MINTFYEVTMDNEDTVYIPQHLVDKISGHPNIANMTYLGNMVVCPNCHKQPANMGSSNMLCDNCLHV